MADGAVAAPGNRLTPAGFAQKWLDSARAESAAAQEHFNDLCRMLDAPTPNEADPTGEWYAFEKGAEKTSGGDGFADVWKRGHFGWEYKGKRKNLNAAYQQLLQYREALENPPLLVVCDLDRFEVHTNFTDTRKEIYRFALADLRDEPAEPLRILRAVMRDPRALRPGQTREQITEQAATRFAALAGSLQQRGHDPQAVAHFLNKILFCFFAEDVGLLPRGLLQKLVQASRRPELFEQGLSDLFDRMSVAGGLFGAEHIEWFNGGLFDGSETLPLTADDLRIIDDASRFDWSQVEPAVLGTLFERGMDPDKRGQLGAHYTDKASILRVIEPVVMTPLLREYAAMQARVLELLAKGRRVTRRTRPENNPNLVFRSFLDRLRGVRVLDPACGSGNFLYVTLQRLKDLEKEALLWGREMLELTQELPGVGPQVVLGIELNAYAAELARVSIWIGEIQWMLANGFGSLKDPILRPLENVECRDAVLVHSEGERPRAADWPDAEFIVGNPPFLGSRRYRSVLGDRYVDALFQAWDGHVTQEEDLVSYWHETVRGLIAQGRVRRAGLLATNSIRGGANRRVLERIKRSGDIFMAWSDEPWVVEGAAVRVSIVGQDDGTETERFLDSKPVSAINADLTAGLDISRAQRLGENSGVAFMGDTKGGPFDISSAAAGELLAAAGNVNGQPNSDVVVPWISGQDITRRPRGMFIIDFPPGVTEQLAAAYERPFEYIRVHVRPTRVSNRREARARRWWRHAEPAIRMREALANTPRYMVTPTVAKHRLFTWQERPTLPDHQLIAIAREGDYTFGVLHSRAHELWSLRKGTSLEDRPRYTPTTTFETFPFPWPLNTPDDELTPAQAADRNAIAAAARELHERRERWLNPPELARMAPDVLPHLPPRPVALNEVAAKQLAKRTLTNLYNARPAWLDLLHRDLDRAVLAAYGWPADLSDDEILRRLLALNLERAQSTGA